MFVKSVPTPMHSLANALIALILLGTFLGGVALFWIARQDDSRAGRLVGLLVAALAIVAGLYLGHHSL